MIRSDIWIATALLVPVVAGPLYACGVSPAQHVANVAEGAGQAAELQACREKGRAAKADGGGAEGYMAAYEACAEASDRKHQVKP